MNAASKRAEAATAPAQSVAEKPRTGIAVRLALAGLAVGTALVLTLIVGSWLDYTPLAFFYVAVALAAALGGLSFASGAALTSVILAELFVHEPSHGFGSRELLLRDVAFVLASMTLAVLVDRLQHARVAARSRQREAEQLAEALREQTGELELQVTESEALANEMEDINLQLSEQTDAASRAAVRAERLHQFTALLLDQVGEAAVSIAIVEDGRRALEATTAAVVRIGETGGMQVMASRGEDADGFAVSSSNAQDGWPVPESMRSGHAVFISDPDVLRRRHPDAVELGSGRHRSWAVLPLEVEKRRLGCLSLAFDRPGEFSSDDRGFMLLVAQQCAQTLDRARIYDLERRARVRAEFAERRLAFLADASQRLASELNFLSTLANLAEYAVPEFADWCLVHLAGDDGRPLLIAAAHDNAERLQMRRDLAQRYPPVLTADHGIGRVLRTGATEHVAPLTDDILRGAARDGEHLRMMRALDLKEQLCVPIRVGGATTGVITFAISDSSRTFDDADIRLAEELGRRAGQAVQNARLYQAAHHASEAKSNFLAVMSHELRTPLNAIIGYSDLLLLGVPNSVPERALHQVDRIRVAAGALLTLVEEVLSFSRIEAGKEEVRISPVDLNRLVRECLAMVEPLAVQKHLDIHVAVPHEVVKIISDDRKIRQILTNLLSNAVKFTEHGSVMLELRNDTAEVAIIVEDTGIGIPQEHLERIFDPFWQVEPATTRRFGGTGLGLGVARKLARLLDGRLHVTSEVGKGSTFTLALPVRAQHASRIA